MTIQSSVKTEGTTVTQLMWFHSCYIHTLLSFIPSNLTFSYLFPLPTPFSSFLPPSFLQIFFCFHSFLPSSPLSPSHLSLFSSYLNLTLHLPSTSSLFFPSHLLPPFPLFASFHPSLLFLPSFSLTPPLLSPLSPTFLPFSLLSCRFPPYPLTPPLLSPLLFLSFLFHFPLPTPFFLALFLTPCFFHVFILLFFLSCFHLLSSFLPFFLGLLISFCLFPSSSLSFLFLYIFPHFPSSSNPVSLFQTECRPIQKSHVYWILQYTKDKNKINQGIPKINE